MVIIETSVFTKQVDQILTEEEYQQLQIELINRPKSGVIIRGTGGLRKIRWSAKGKGKRGGSRIIYYWAVSEEQLLMLLVYTKKLQDDLSNDQKKVLRKIVEADYP